MSHIRWESTHLDRRPASIMSVAQESLGLYVSPPVSHLELAARVPDYSSADLESLMSGRRLVGLRCLRGSTFLMPTELLPVIVPATRDRNVRAFASYLRRTLSTASYAQWSERILDVLGVGESLTKKEITSRLGRAGADHPYLSNVISQMATESRLIGIRVPVSWRSARIAYTRWDDWLPEVDVESPDPGEARMHLAHMYVSSFGPASVDDFAWWSGLTKAQAQIALVASGADMVGGLFDFGDTSDESPSGVRLLPIWDTLFVTWKDRSRFIAESLLPYVYDRSGNATSVVLLDGEVAGVWAMGPDNDPLEIRVAPFDWFTARQWSAVEKEALVVARLAGAGEVKLVRADHPPDLREGHRNLFMRPV